ncbi:MAG: metallophosphoesterase [Candidatus Gracilibacteria bacterium]|nr:metallophosphoesterase [Candidatus Gracilibacteria bacterium]
MNSIIFASMFLIVLVSVLFLGNFSIYVFLIKFFNISNHNVKIYIGGILFILGISFILASILTHYFDNPFSRGAYFISGLWLGFLVNINMFIGVLVIIDLILKKYGFIDYKVYAGGIMIFLCIVYSSYGIFNALSPQVNEVSVKLKNLPDSWKNKKIVMISDVHLGNIYNDDFMKKVVDKINIINPEAVFIVGDLFDGMDGHLDKYVKPLDNLKTKKGTFFVTGNHETYLGVDNALKSLENTGVKILDDEKLDIDGIEIIGLSYPLRGEFKDFKKTFSNLKLSSDKPKILLYHNPMHLDEAKNAGIDLQLSGHTHRGQLFPFNLITSIIYAGHDLGLTKIGDFQIFTSIGVSTWGPAMRTNSRSEIVEITLR